MALLLAANRERLVVLASVFIAAIIVAGGGCGSTSPNGNDAANNKAAKKQLPVLADDSEPTTAAEVLDRMKSAYRNAKSYRDKGKILFALSVDGRTEKEEFDLQVEFQRPNLLRLDFQAALPEAISDVRGGRVLMIADGQKIYAKPEGLDNQVLVATDLDQITASRIYEIPGLAPLMPRGITGASVALDLLTSSAPLQELDGTEARLIEPADLNGRACYRVRFDTPDGPLTIWVDKKTYVLRRMQYPTNELLASLESQGVTAVEVTAELTDATLDPKPIDDGRFTWTKDDDEHYVQSLVPPPNPSEAPSKFLGEPLPPFEFTSASGEKLNAKSLDGKVTVIDLWATWCGPCQRGLPGVDALRKKYADNDKVQFLALSIDDASVKNDDIAAALAKLKVATPWARLTPPASDKLLGELGILGIPAMLMLSAEGRVQFLHVGLIEDAEQSLAPVIDALAAGKDVAKETRENWEARLEQYKNEIRAATEGAQTTTIEIPRAKIAEASEPKTFKLKPLWKAQSVKSPGNILVVPSDKGPRIFVLDGWHEVVELDQEGKEIARHADLVPGQSPLAILRTAVDKQGERLFVLGAPGQEQLHVFDSDWKLRLTYPTEPSAKIFDVLPADLDGDGEPELNIGYFGQAGVHEVSLDGKRLWRNRTIEDVTGLTPTGPDADGKRRLLCTHRGGTIVPINYEGRSGEPVRMPGHVIVLVRAGQLEGEGKWQYAGVAVEGSGKRQVIGIQLQPSNGSGGEVTWRYPIPEGEHAYPIDALTWGQLGAGPAAQWLLAVADGSIHIISPDGAARDQFNTGKELTGLAFAMLAGTPTLLIASPEGLEALTVDR